MGFMPNSKAQGYIIIIYLCIIKTKQFLREIYLLFVDGTFWYTQYKIDNTIYYWKDYKKYCLTVYIYVNERSIQYCVILEEGSIIFFLRLYL